MGQPQHAAPPATAKVLTTPDQIRALAQEDRLAMLRLLRDEASSVSALATKLGIPANRAHYHLQQLLAAGLVREVGTGARRWNSEERYYGAAAHHFLVDPALGAADAETGAALARAAETIFLDWRRREVLEIDLGQIASRAVNQGIRARRGENVLVMFSPFVLELAEAVMVEVEAVGAIPRVRPWSRNYVVRQADRMSAEEIAALPHVPEEAERDLHAVVYLHSLLVQGPPPSPEQLAKIAHHQDQMSAWRHRMRERGVRYMNVTVPHRAELSLAPGGPDAGADLYWRAMLADSADLLYRGQRIRTRAGGKRTIRLTCPRGTDLAMPIDPALTQINDGLVSEADVAQRFIFDHLPSGHISFLPREDGPGAEGVFFAEYAFFGKMHCRNVRAVFSAGRLESISCDAGEEELRRRLAGAVNAGPTGAVGYITIGLNPVPTAISGTYQLDMCAAGNVSIVLGNNELMGGKVASTFTLVLPAAGVSAWADDAELVGAGRLVL